MKKGNFSKVCVVASIFFIVVYVIISLSLQFTVQMPVDSTLTSCVFAFFGTELAVSGLIKMGKVKNQDTPQDTNPEESDS